MSILDYIEFFPGFVDGKLCDELISHYKENAKWESSTFSDGTGIMTQTAERVKMEEFWIQQDMKFYSEFQAHFQKAVVKYLQKHPKFEPQRFTPFRLNHYPVGGFMEQHIDNIHHSHGQQFGYPHVTVLVMLNDNYEGGEFDLCDGGFVPETQQGSVIVFPSNFMYPHQVQKVTSGDRFSLMTWIM
ncbi:MAG: hypothetical protein COA96_04290 [SAR86 cluster bacterium]|uniref:Fe2OG dioxygenase domain-containing protein n=1 Tax=SAR86 cluster bacterium TaxID=2030880 RepID=A0A2A5B5N8_9GAMM|nr:MAG: hypothetical protein COA96_04290 [SAR86 cluster bacterium]